MKIVSRQIKVIRPISYIQTTKHVINSCQMFGTYLALIASFIQPLQTQMFERSDHIL